MIHEYVSLEPEIAPNRQFRRMADAWSDQDSVHSDPKRLYIADIIHKSDDPARMIKF